MFFRLFFDKRFRLILYQLSQFMLRSFERKTDFYFLLCFIKTFKILQLYDNSFFSAQLLCLNFSLILNPNIFHVWNNADVFASWGLCLDRTV